MKDQAGRILSLEGGTEVVIHPDGRTYLTGFGMYGTFSKEIPRIYLSPKDALYLAKSIIKYVEEPVN